MIVQIAMAAARGRVGGGRELEDRVEGRLRVDVVVVAAAAAGGGAEEVGSVSQGMGMGRACVVGRERTW